LNQSWRKRAYQWSIGLFLSIALAAAAQTAPVNPLDLRSRMQAAAAAQQSGDASAVADANKFVIALALREMSDVHASAGQFPSAVELCKRSLDFEDTVAARFQLAIAYTRSGRTDEALAEVAKTLAADSGNAAAWNLQGKLWMMRKEYQKAVDSLARTLALQNDPEVAYTMATALLRTNQLEKAAAVFEQLQAASGDRATGHILAGRAYEGANLPAQAEAEYKKAIARDAKASRGHYFLGLFYLTANGWNPTPQARAEFEAEAALNPTDFFGNYFLGYLLSQEKNYDESDRYLNAAALARPEWPEPFLYLGLNAFGSSSYARAEPALRKAIQLTGSDESRNNYQIRRAYFALGRTLIISGKQEEGTKLVVRSREMGATVMANDQQALASEQAAPGAELVQTPSARTETTSPSKTEDSSAMIDPEIWKTAPIADSEKAQAQETERRLRTVLANAYNDLGTSQARRHEYELAVAYFRDAERWDSNAPGLMRNLGLAAFLSKNYTESVRALKQVVQEDPSDQRAVGMLALSLFSTKNYAEAAKTFDRIPDVAASDPRMAYGWALSLAKTNDRQRASAVLERLVTQPIPPEMLVLAGRLYVEMGDQKNAEICFKRAKEQDPNVSVPR